ncbi:FMN-binding negative transcriptional regulator [Streptomyces bathyalis]|uniref:FMN-binding negative transcriptional regulator n=1 Tax=Streptomyces bathyalis TaxID=2710756 RepID=UPI0031B5DF3E
MPCWSTSPGPTLPGRRSRPIRRSPPPSPATTRSSPASGAPSPASRPPTAVPTSYYAAVQFTCWATIVDEPGAEAELLRRQMAHFQPDGDHAPIDPDQPPYGRMLPGIRAQGAGCWGGGVKL